MLQKMSNLLQLSTGRLIYFQASKWLNYIKSLKLLLRLFDNYNNQKTSARYIVFSIKCKRKQEENKKI